MQGKFVFALAFAIVVVAVGPTSGCKVCGVPWCSSEETHDPVELKIIEKRNHRSSSSVEDTDRCHFCGGPKHLIPDVDVCHNCGGYIRPRIPQCLRKSGRFIRKLECKCKAKNRHYRD